jgi:predicted nucleic acid-binding protein
MYLLDTNIVSELRRIRPHGRVVSWLEAIADEDLYISAVTLGEIQAGIVITRDQNAQKTTEIETWADHVANTFNIITMDAATFRIWARLMHHQSDSVYVDAMIAATASRHNLKVATRNVSDFERFSVQIINPFND